MSTFTVTPNISYGPNGEEIVDYDSAFVDTGNQRQQVREAFNRDNSFNDDLYYQRPDGSIGHRYADLDGERYQTFEQDYVAEVDADDYLASADITSEDAQYLTDICGGSGQYEDMLRWAASNLPQSTQDQFDDILASADVSEMEAAITQLFEYYSNNRFDDTPTDRYSDEDEDSYDDDEEGYEDDLSDDFVESLWESVGGHGAYQDLIEWAADNLPENEIEAFDYLIDSGDQHAIAQAVSTLHNMYINY